MSLRTLSVLLLALAVPACTTPEAGPTSLLAAPAPGEGTQLTIDTAIPSGTDARVCQLVAVPEAITIGRVESRSTAGTHHVEVALTTHVAGEIDGAPFACGTRPIARLGSFYAANETAGALTFGADAVLDVAAGRVLLVEIHALNATAQQRATSVAVNLYAATSTGPKLGSFVLTVGSPKASCGLAGQRYVQVLGGDAGHGALSVTLEGGALPSAVPLFEEEAGDPLVFRPALRVEGDEALTVACTAPPCTLRGTYYPAGDEMFAVCAAE